MGSGPSSAKVSHKTMGQDFNFDKFLGNWCEISHIDRPYQSNCDFAVLDLVKEGEIYKITNHCTRYGKSGSSQKGQFRILNPNDPSKLEIQFETLIPGWVKFWIYETDYQSYAIVGNPSGYFWILSREPNMTFCKFADLKDKAGSYGFDVERVRADINSLKKCQRDEL
jgi:lipocalin